MNRIRTKGFGKKYDTIGSTNFYQSFSLNKNLKYNNPHSKKFNHIICQILKHIQLNNHVILDLSAGSGEITKELQKVLTLKNDIIGCDPYLFEQYKQLTNLKCHKYKFDDIIHNKAIDFPKYFGIIFCSYALHLCNDINQLLKYFSTKSEYFCILSPNGHNLQKIEETGYCIDWQFKHKNIKIYLLKSTII
jgi:hypothetical protein